jgi:hypothetical protein
LQNKIAGDAAGKDNGAAGDGIGIEYRLPQRAGAGVVQVGSVEHVRGRDGLRGRTYRDHRRGRGKDQAGAGRQPILQLFGAGPHGAADAGGNPAGLEPAFGELPEPQEQKHGSLGRVEDRGG